jgi:hypothetical protein
MYVHAYTGYPDDIEPCFVQDNSRPLYFDGYTDVDINSNQISLTLYTFQNGTATTVTMKPGDVSITTSGKMLTIKIKADAGSPPHLGPGPYMAVIGVSGDAVSRESSGSPPLTWGYAYRTWKKSSSPLDCWNAPPSTP